MSSMMILSLASTFVASQAQPPWPVTLQSEVVRLTRAADGELALFVKDLRTGERYTYNAATPMYLASTVKIFFLIELLKQADAKRVQLDDAVVLEEADLRDGSPRLGAGKVGEGHTLRELAFYMMTESDNTATDRVLARIGIDNVNASLREDGFGVHRLTTMLDVRRNVFRELTARADELTPQQVRAVQERPSPSQRVAVLNDLLKPERRWRTGDLQRAWASYYASGVNSASMETVGAYLEALVRGKLLGPERTREALNVMLACKTGARRLRKKLPADVRLAHKTGTQYQRVCNSGVLFVTPDRPVVIAACTKDFPTTASAEAVLAAVGHAASEAVRDTPLAEQAEPLSAFAIPFLQSAPAGAADPGMSQDD